jgi:uncharacterized phage protein (TIGR01671 family)
MRDILFRGNRTDNGEWVEGYYVNSIGPDCEPNETRHYIVTYPGDWHEVYTSTIGQYTGLTDRNGTRIFEGDVIKIPWDDGYQNRVVIFENGMFKARSIPDSYGGFFSVSLCSFAGFDGPKMHCEVVGNVFDDADLLK